MKVLAIVKMALLSALLVTAFACGGGGGGADGGGTATTTDTGGGGGGNADTDNPPIGDTGVICTPNCTGLQCGLDPVCGVECGPCGAGLDCNAAQQCEAAPCTAEEIAANCAGKVCGDDGCGGTCAPGCDPGLRCDMGACIVCTAGDIAANCAGKQCGDDGCGGTCPPGCDPASEECNDLGLCEEICVPNCAGKVCGSDGCEGQCGPGCTAPDVCNDATGQCDFCTPVCGDRQCGPDPQGCGTMCGTCTAPMTCNDGGMCAEAGEACLDWFTCANACEPGPNRTQCMLECDQRLTGVALTAKNALLSCQSASCQYCSAEADPNQCFNDCTFEQCGDEFYACLATSAQGAGTCEGFYVCLNSCPDATTQPDAYSACLDACIAQTAYESITAAFAWEDCALTACPDFAQACVQAAAEDPAICGDLYGACFGAITPPEFCTGEGCLDCGGMNQCLMGCGDNQDCANNCFSSATQEAYDLYQEISQCIFDNCPDFNDPACQNEMLSEGGACAAMWTECTGGGTTTTGACDPAEHADDPDYCYDCAGALTCMNGCGTDMTCAQNCLARGTADAQAQFQAIGTCLLAACEDPNDAACQQAALTTGDCADEYAACAGAKKSRPAVSPAALLSGVRQVSSFMRPVAERRALMIVSHVGMQVRKTYKNER